MMHRLRPLSLLLLLIFYESSFLFAQDDSTLHKALWQVQPIFIDGSDADWPAALPFNDENGKLRYAITNDTKALYIFLVTKDPLMEQKMLKAGLTLYLNREGKKRENTSINYSLEASDDGMPAGDLRMVKLNVLMGAKEMELLGFSKGNGRQPIDGTNELGVQVHVGFKETGEVLYEAAIPLAALYKNGSDAEKPLAVGIAVKGLPRTAPAAVNNNNPVPASGRGGRGGSPGNMSGAPTPMLSRDIRSAMQDIFITTKVWHTVQLAKQ
ncbi:MAG: hypothetical protein ICV51_14715 [Flavisolibacter sp.]|nr:hypothetical protein [Flavisolibacter sp.]